MCRLRVDGALLPSQHIQLTARWWSQLLVPKPCQGPYPSYAIAITSRDNQNHRTMERRDYDVTKETHYMALSIVSPYSGSDYSDTSNSLNMQAREIPVPFTIIHAWIILLSYTVV